MLLFVDSNQTRQSSSRPTRKRARSKPKPIEGTLLALLDDTRPAGPWANQLSETGMRLLCLSTILQAVRDIRNSHDPELAAEIRAWLMEYGAMWIKIMGVQRDAKNDEMWQLLYRTQTNDPAQPDFFDTENTADLDAIMDIDPNNLR